MCSGSLARFLFIPSVRFKSTGHPSALASLLGPSIAQDEMTLVDILNSARLNPQQKRRSLPTLLLFYVSFHLLLYPAFVTLSCLRRPLFYCLWGPVWKMEIFFPIISQLCLTILSVFFFFFRREDQTSWVCTTVPTLAWAVSVVSSFRPPLNGVGGGQNLHVAIWLEVTEGIKRKD